MKRRSIFSFTVVALAFTAVAFTLQPVAAPASAQNPNTKVERGSYLVKIMGCNDCHTPGYGATGGKVPMEQWLTGSDQGFLGPWGTTYPSNLRLSVSKMSEADWVAYSGSFHTRPPMPDFMVRDLPEQDRRALHRFITSLGTAGKDAPAYLPPGQSPSPPYFQLVLPEALTAPTPATGPGPGPASTP